ncbi:MAG TPA: YbaK/EbsC family protein [Egibacteraceae bacterium]|nr:YbaK/EbsC family protein [Egibacteraceae bacterium]
MASSADRFVAAARDRGLIVDVQRWPEGTRTARDAARAVGCDVGQIVKSLVMMADGGPLVVLTSGANQVDVARVALLIGAAAVRKATADEARAATGYSIGGTPPLGFPEPLTVLMDADLFAYSQVWAAAGTPQTVFSAPPEALRAAAGARRAVVAR